MLTEGAGPQLPQRGTTRRVAIMQPYFFPYAGYFRLLSAADVFVIFDCVQFPRRGRVHRAEVPGPAGPTEWLTLPLLHQPRDVLIRDLKFADDAVAEFDKRLDRLPWLRTAEGPAADELRSYLHSPKDDVLDYLETGLRLVCSLLDLKTPLLRSSSLQIDESLRGEERILRIASTLGATHYLNPPGGRALYNPVSFQARGIELEFLPPYTGPYRTLLANLSCQDAREIRRDLSY